MRFLTLEKKLKTLYIIPVQQQKKKKKKKKGKSALLQYFITIPDGLYYCYPIKSTFTIQKL